jgi:hypothetical protein
MVAMTQSLIACQAVNKQLGASHVHSAGTLGCCGDAKEA